MRFNTQDLPSWASVLLLVLATLAGAWAYPGLLAGQVLLNLLIDNAFLLVVAVGMSFVILSGGIVLSVGSVVALTTMLLALGVERAQLPPALLIPALVLGGAAFGAVMGWVIQAFEVPPFIVTLAGLFLARGLCYLLSVDSIPITDATLAACSQARWSVGALTGVLMLGLIQTLILFDGTLSSWWTRIVIGALLGLFCGLQRALVLLSRRRRATS